MQKDIILIKGDKSHIHYDASRRLDLKLSEKSSDIWAADDYTHKSFYLSFGLFIEHVAQSEPDEAETLALRRLSFTILSRKFYRISSHFS